MERLPLSETSLETPYRQQLIDALDDYRFRPGGAAHRFIEQRRLAIVIDEVLPGFRDLIHDRVPTADQVVDRMVAYYDTPGEEQRKAILLAYNAAEQVLSRNSLIDRKMIGDYEVYSRLVGDSGERKPMIDVLRAMHIGQLNLCRQAILWQWRSMIK